MYTYIYTENHMNFFRTGKVIGLTAGVVFNIDNSTLKHKAVFFPNQTAATNQVQLTFWDAAGVSTGVTLAVPAIGVGAQAPTIFPGVLKSVLSSSATSIVLLG